MPESPKTVFKAGLQSDDDPWVFVMSDPTPDSYGDIVEPSWKLAQFKRNPIALWMHDSHVPIGTWERVRVEGDKLVGRLQLAARGTSEFIDTLWSLVEQRILRAVSVGFRPGKAEPLDPDDPWSGYRLSDNLLLETSLVSVGANPTTSARPTCAAHSPRQVICGAGRAFANNCVSADTTLPQPINAGNPP